MGLHRLVRATLVGAIAALLISTSALAGTRIEDAFYNGQTVQFIQPAVFSADTNGGTFACFGLGPDLSRTHRSAVTPTLYVILNDFATQDHCDGNPTAARHDHVLSTIPGQPDYTGSWKLILAQPGPNFDYDPTTYKPYTSVAAVLAGVAAGELVLADPGVTMIAPVVR